MTRSVANHEEFTKRLTLLVSGRPEHVRKYVETVARKFYLKNWSKSAEIIRAKGVPKFKGIKDSLTVTFETADGPVIKHVQPGTEMYEMLTRNAEGAVVFLDLEYLAEISAELQPILDWLQDTYRQPRDLSFLPFQAASQKSKEWHEERVRRAEKLREDERKQLAISSLDGSRPLCEITFNLNGEPKKWVLYNLVTFAALQYEGNKLHHCVGDEFQNYWKSLQNEEIMIWSLRQELLDPLITFTVTRAIYQRADGSYSKHQLDNPMITQFSGLSNRRLSFTEAQVLKPFLTALQVQFANYPEFSHTEDLGGRLHHSDLAVDERYKWLRNATIETVKYQVIGELPFGMEILNK